MKYKIHTVIPLNQLPFKIDVTEKQTHNVLDSTGNLLIIDGIQQTIIVDVIIGYKWRFVFQVISYIEGCKFVAGIPKHSQSDMTHIDLDTTEEKAVIAAMQSAAVIFIAENYTNS